MNAAASTTSAALSLDRSRANSASYTLSGTYNSNWPNISGVANLQLTGAPVNTFKGRALQLFGAGQLEIPTSSGDALDCPFIAILQAGAPTIPVPTESSPLSNEPTLRGFS